MGIVEEAFSLFDWGDLAEADRSALAIPKHRIEYFKVDERVVWRKSDRVDDVFGSTGSGKTLADVLKELATPSTVSERSTISPRTKEGEEEEEEKEKERDGEPRIDSMPTSIVCDED